MLEEIYLKTIVEKFFCCCCLSNRIEHLNLLEIKVLVELCHPGLSNTRSYLADVKPDMAIGATSK